MLNEAMPMRRVSLAALTMILGLALAGCESTRFGGFGGGSASSRRPVTGGLVEPETPSVPSGSVIAEPLAPLGGASSPPTLGAGEPTQPVPTLGGGGGGGVSSSPGSRSAAVGGWTARDAGGSCKINLSSSPSLDLYRASAGGCANKDLSRVTAWDYRDGEVYLFQPGGAVAARLRPGSGGLTGVLAKSGAPLTLTRG